MNHEIMDPFASSFPGVVAGAGLLLGGLARAEVVVEAVRLEEGQAFTVLAQSRIGKIC